MKPYCTVGLATLYHGDCRELMPQLSGVSCVITDPPYGQTSLAWDQWCEGWIAALPSTCLWTFGTLRMFLRHGHEFADAGWRFAQDLVWEKHNGSSFHRDRFRRVHDSLAHFYRGRWNEQVRVVPTTLDAKAKVVIRRKERPTHFGAIPNTGYVSVDGGPRLRRSVIQLRSCHGTATHPTEKPVPLVSLLVEYSCPLTGIVLDPFAGSGSALEAAYMLGRQAIGIEVNEQYCEQIARRLERVAVDYAMLVSWG